MKTEHKPGVVAHIYNPSYSGGEGRRIVSLRPVQAKASKTLSQKQNTNRSVVGHNS
jgi:hypothetical protein